MKTIALGTIFWNQLGPTSVRLRETMSWAGQFGSPPPKDDQQLDGWDPLCRCQRQVNVQQVWVHNGPRTADPFTCSLVEPFLQAWQAQWPYCIFKSWWILEKVILCLFRMNYTTRKPSLVLVFSTATNDAPYGSWRMEIAADLLSFLFCSLLWIFRLIWAALMMAVACDKGPKVLRLGLENLRDFGDESGGSLGGWNRKRRLGRLPTYRVMRFG